MLDKITKRLYKLLYILSKHIVKNANQDATRSKFIQQISEYKLKPVVLDGSFKCPVCGFSEKHLASCVYRTEQIRRYKS